MMTLAEFEIAPKRELSEPQERRLNRHHLSGDFGAGPFSTLQSLMDKGFLVETELGLVFTKRAEHYCHHHGENMPL